MGLAGDARPGPDRVDQAAVPDRDRTRVEAETTALPAAAPIRANRPSRPPNDPSALQALGVGRAACRRLRQAASTPHPPSTLTLRGAAANPLEDQHQPGHQR